VLATLTGETLTRVEVYLTDVIGDDPEGGTQADEMAWAFDHYGYAMNCIAAYETPCSGPLLIDWLDALAPTWRLRHPLVIAIEEPGEDAHWVAVWNESICDSLSAGRWLPLARSEHRHAFVSHAWTITPPPLACGPVRMG
jgi:hypothetical protein